MSFNVFLAFCILGCDFLIYFLFQWIYGEKHRKHSRRLAARQEKRSALSDRPVRFVVVVKNAKRIPLRGPGTDATPPTSGHAARAAGWPSPPTSLVVNVLSRPWPTIFH
jgi:hypothetical protein